MFLVQAYNLDHYINQNVKIQSTSLHMKKYSVPLLPQVDPCKTEILFWHLQSVRM